MISFYKPLLDDAEEQAAIRVLRSGQIAQGPEVEAFEREAAHCLKAPPGHECVAVSSCTAGLYLLLQALGIGYGWRVAVPDLTFAATINAVIAAGAEPVIADVDENGLLDPSTVGWPDANQGLNAIIGVHFAGIDPRCGLIRDQAHSFQVGAYVENSAWSFFPTKNVTAGEGGLVGCSAELAAKVRAMRNHGRTGTYEVEYPGSLNFRMTDLQAAILREQIKKIPSILAAKYGIDKIYREELDGAVTLPPRHVTHLFWIRHPERDRIKEALAVEGVETSIHYRPLSTMECYKQWAKGTYVMARAIADATLSLPFWPGLEDDEVRRIAGIVRKAVA